MDIAILLTIIGLLLTFVFGILPLLKEKKKLQKNKDDGLYYETGDPDNPYCPHCYTKKRKIILIDKSNRKCPKCKMVFERPPAVVAVCPKQGPRFRI
jgi:hypothetical protein